MASKRILVESGHEDELATPQEIAEPRDEGDELPEKWRGKSTKDLIALIEEKEAMIGRQSNEVGGYRKLVDELLETKRSADLAKAEKDPAADLTSDRLLENPAEAIRPVVEQIIREQLKPVTTRVEDRERQADMERFERDYPTASQIAQSEDFQNWVMRSHGRAYRASLASKGDLEAARSLLDDYNDVVAARNPAEEKAQRKDPVAKARAASSDRPGNGRAESPKKVYRQSELVQMINKDPEKWRSESFQAELRTAIKEGRVVS